MIALTTYVPFYLLTLVITVFIFYLLLYPASFLKHIKKIYTFVLQNKIFTLFLLWMLISISITQMAANFTSYKEQTSLLFLKIANVIKLEKHGFNTSQLLEPIQKFIDTEFWPLLWNSINNIVHIVSRSVLVFIFMLFLLLGKTENQRNGVLKQGEDQIQS